MSKIDAFELMRQKYSYPNKNHIIYEDTCKIFTNIKFKKLHLDMQVADSKDNSYINYKENSLPKSYITELSGYEDSKISKIIFRNCSFNELEIMSIINKDIIFENCIICKFSMIDVTYKKESNSIQINGGIIKNLIINKSTINAKFYINKQCDNNRESTTIKKLSIKDTVFEENFKLHNCKVYIVEIEDTDFKKNADFFMSEFKKGTLKKSSEENICKDDIGFKAINFESLALFGDTKFQEKLIFKYVTFKGHNHFKSAKLHKGLDLEYTNIQNEINFYGLNIVDTSKTSQETYRIIKHQFEKLGNKIEANKYHALELGQKRLKLKKERPRNWKDYLVFKVHDLSSEHSTNWFLALKWIIATSLLTVLFLNFNIVLELLTQKIPFKFEYIEKVFYEFFKYIYILNKDEKLLELPWLFVLNKLLLGYLYYQFLLSVRKDTRK